MLKRKWVIILAVVVLFTLVVGGTALAGAGPQSRTNSTVVPSSSTTGVPSTATTCSPGTTCTPSTLGGTVVAPVAAVSTASTLRTQTQLQDETCDGTCTPSTLRTQTQLQDETCDGTCDPTSATAQDQSRDHSGVRDGSGDGNNYAHGN
jgi:hypothetical protein